MTTFDLIQTKRKALKLAKKKGVRLHNSLSGYLVRRNGRIIKQSFSVRLISQHLESLP